MRMKTYIVVSLFIVQVGLACAGTTKALTHTLTPYLTNDAFGTYPLPMVWSGVQTITYQTGYFKYGGRGAMSVPEEDAIRFNQYSNLSKSWMARQMLDDSTVSNSNFLKKVYGYVPVLPPDSELIQLHDDSAFTNLFKLNVNTLRSRAFKQQTFHFYTLGNNNTIRIKELIVEELEGNSKTNIQIVLIKSGILSPKRRL